MQKNGRGRISCFSGPGGEPNRCLIGLSMSSSAELSELLETAKRAAALAGEVIMPLYRTGLAVDFKADKTPVTEADRRAERVMRDFLAAECPGHGILGEEYGETAGDGRNRWILDPIDGTKSFIHHVPLFGTLVALEQDGEPVIGVIACHGVGETAYAAKGGGAFIDGVPARVSNTADLADATVLTTSIAGLTRFRRSAVDTLSREAGMFRGWGDCYGYLMVAAGRADAMIDPQMNLWDVAALVPIVNEAGGRLTQWTGEPSVGDSAVATNGLLHDALLAAISERPEPGD